MQELTIAARVENLDKVTDFVRETLAVVECPTKLLMQIDLVVEEIFVNVASYAYPEGAGDVTIQSEVEKAPAAITLKFIDGGIPYNPLKNDPPDLNLPVEEKKIGGLGIYLVKEMADEIFYDYFEGKNILIIKKRI